MRIKLIPLVLSTGLAGLLLAQPAAAQGASKGDVAVGYQFMNLSASGDSQSMPAGWFVDVSGNLNRSVAAVAQFGGNYKSLSESVVAGGVTANANADVRVHQFMGGVRVSAHPSPTVAPFVHILAGAAYGSVSYSGTGSIAGQTIVAMSGTDSGTNFALQTGGGTNIWMTPTIGLRMGVDYVRIFETDGGANVFRFAAGVGFKF
jgi:outer membrane protein with beta-barrel domain